MKIGVGLPNQVRNVRPVVIPEWASRAEKAGFSTLGSVGRVAYPGVMDTVALAASAGATSTIGLISNILIAPAWPPVLLAKEAAGIDAVSGGRLTLGLGLGGRPDDFVVDGLGATGTGKRLDHDLEVYHSVWRGDPVGGGSNPAAPIGTRQVPLMFGGMVPAAFDRVARWGQGYIGASLPPAMVAPAFQGVGTAWKNAGREGRPRLVAIAYFALGDVEKGRGNVWDYYISAGDEVARLITGGILAGPMRVKTGLKEFAEIGADEVIFNPTLDDLDEIERLADVVL